MERLTIILTPDLADLVRAAVDAGNYGSASEVMRQALHDWELAEARRQAELATLRNDARKGLDQIAAGKSRSFNVGRIEKAGQRLVVNKP